MLWGYFLDLDDAHVCHIKSTLYIMLEITIREVARVTFDARVP